MRAAVINLDSTMLHEVCVWSDDGAKAVVVLVAGAVGGCCRSEIP